MIQHIRHVGLRVKRLSKSIEFYENLGFILVSRKQEQWDGKRLRIAKLETQETRYSPTTILELVQGKWPNHFALELEDITKITCDYRKRGRVLVGFIRDPDGNYIELVEVK